MALLWLMVSALFLGAVSADLAPANGRIIGGEPTTIDKYPSVVQVEFFDRWDRVWYQNCAASIITSRHVLSAAHCFSGVEYHGPESRRIRAGATYRETGGVIVYVERVVIHPIWGTIGYDGDISVVRLSSNIVYTPLIQPTAIVAQGSVVPDDVPVVHVGWGATQFRGRPSPVLLDVTVSTINNELCTHRYINHFFPHIVTENMICAGVLDVGGKDACCGDSGGPMYYRDILVGVISWGWGCADDTYPGVSMAIGAYTNWIVANAV